MDEDQLDERGLAAARAYAEWNIGDPSWADLILMAYLHPDMALAELQAAGWEGVPNGR